MKLPSDEGNLPDYSPPQEPMSWCEKRVPAEIVSLDQTWTAMFNDFRNGVTYPISQAQALKIMQVVDDVGGKHR